jgi:hypothetical protein
LSVPSSDESGDWGLGNDAFADEEAASRNEMADAFKSRWEDKATIQHGLKDEETIKNEVNETCFRVVCLLHKG